MNPQRQVPPQLVVRQADPFNSSPRSRLARQFMPHRGVLPGRSPAGSARGVGRYRLTLRGDVDSPFTLSLDELRRRFMKSHVTCAAVRREPPRELLAVAPLPGRSPGARPSNAHWAACGGAICWKPRARPRPGRRTRRSRGSAPWSSMGWPRDGQATGGSLAETRWLSDAVLLAWNERRARCRRFHGAPLRVVAPGVIGARSATELWLASIRVQARPSGTTSSARRTGCFRRMGSPGGAFAADWERAPRRRVRGHPPSLPRRRRHPAARPLVIEAHNLALGGATASRRWKCRRRRHLGPRANHSCSASRPLDLAPLAAPDRHAAPRPVPDRRARRQTPRATSNPRTWPGSGTPKGC